MPASNARAIAKARVLAADTLIFDLEDSVGPGEREAAHDNLRAWVAGGDFGHRERVIRTSAADSESFVGDLAVALECAPDAVLLPKVEDARTLALATVHLDRAGSPVKLWAMIESPRALLAIAGIAEVERVWNELVPGWPFQYSFLDEHFEELYRSDRQMEAVVAIMAILAIFIACMGLFGLAAITMEKKTKEVGIRKVLGATAGQIVMHLSKNFAGLVLLAFALFSPLAFWAMSRWLENFAYRIEVSPLAFVFGGLLALAIALLTISFHTLRHARANPAEALRTE